MASLAAGEVVEVTVVRLAHFGAWVDHAGRVGLVNIPEIAWFRIDYPKKVLFVGQRVQVKVLTVTADSFRASIRAVHPEADPWFAPERFAVGTEFETAVVRVTEYGCFVELRPEVWGLLRRESVPRAMSVGDVVRVRVVRCDMRMRRVEVEAVSI